MIIPSLDEVPMNVTIYLPDELHEQVKGRGINVSQVCQNALRSELSRLATRHEDMERIVLYDRSRKSRVAFTGRPLTLVDNVLDVYATASGRIATYDREEQVLSRYDNLWAAGDALGSEVIEEILERWGDYLDDPIIELDL